MKTPLEAASALQHCGIPADGALENALLGQIVNLQKTVPAKGVTSYPSRATGLNFNLIQWVRHSQSQKVVWLVFNSSEGRFVYGYRLVSKHPKTDAKCYMCGQPIMVFDGDKWNCPRCYLFYVPLYKPPYMPLRLQKEYQEKPNRPCGMCGANEVAGNSQFCPNCRKLRRRASNREAARRSRRKQGGSVSPSASTDETP
jgi:hypothetical protein